MSRKQIKRSGDFAWLMRYAAQHPAELDPEWQLDFRLARGSLLQQDWLTDRQRRMIDQLVLASMARRFRRQLDAEAAPDDPTIGRIEGLLGSVAVMGQLCGLPRKTIAATLRLVWRDAA